MVSSFHPLITLISQDNFIDSLKQNNINESIHLTRTPWYPTFSSVTSYIICGTQCKMKIWGPLLLRISRWWQPNTKPSARPWSWPCIFYRWGTLGLERHSKTLPGPPWWVLERWLEPGHWTVGNCSHRLVSHSWASATTQRHHGWAAGVHTRCCQLDILLLALSLVVPTLSLISFFFKKIFSIYLLSIYIAIIYLDIWLCRVLVAAHGNFVAVCGILVAACGIVSCGMWDLVPWPGIEPRAPCIGSMQP